MPSTKANDRLIRYPASSLTLTLTLTSPPMTNPFENEEAEYLVLWNAEGQCSLWPTFREIPAGWTAVGPRGKRRDCLDWVEANWTDMRPKSLAAAHTER